MHMLEKWNLSIERECFTECLHSIKKTKKEFFEDLSKSKYLSIDYWIFLEKERNHIREIRKEPISKLLLFCYDFRTASYTYEELIFAYRYGKRKGFIKNNFDYVMTDFNEYRKYSMKNKTVEEYYDTYSKTEYRKPKHFIQNGSKKKEEDIDSQKDWREFKGIDKDKKKNHRRNFGYKLICGCKGRKKQYDRNCEKEENYDNYNSQGYDFRVSIKDYW